MNTFNKITTAAALAVAISSPAVADTYVTVPVVDYEPVFTSFLERNPVRECTTRSVPMYGNRGYRRGASTFDTLGGAIIGGAIGNQFGGGTGKDALTVLGAIAGADYMNKSQRGEEYVTGYRDVEDCRVVYNENVVKKLDHYRVTVDFNGQQHVVKRNALPMGGTIRLRLE